MGDPGITKRNRASKRRGSHWEVTVRNWLVAAGITAVRIARRGRRDIGDVVAITEDGHHFVIECKDVARADWANWCAQAELEAKQYAEYNDLDEDLVHWVVIWKRRRQTPDKAYVITSLEQWGTTL